MIVSPAIPKRSDDARALQDLADRIEQLVPDRRDPERFHVEKSEIVHELRRIAGG